VIRAAALYRRNCTGQQNRHPPERGRRLTRRDKKGVTLAGVKAIIIGRKGKAASVKQPAKTVYAVRYRLGLKIAIRVNAGMMIFFESLDRHPFRVVWGRGRFEPGRL